MLGSPYVMIGTIALYLIMVLKVAPKLMKNRQPFKVDLLMQIYNVLQVLLNLFIFYELMCYSYLRSDFSILCQGHDPNDVRLNTLKLRRPVLLYLISKYLDIFDTVFFVLRKKYNQITLLHMYHHSLMIFSPYAYGSRFFASHFTSTGVLNSLVHAVMYTYYFVACLKLNFDLSKWKKRVTQMQLIQFGILGIHFSLPIVLGNPCNLDVPWTWVAFSNNICMIVLFSNFYYHAYIRKAKKKL
uniref:Elongation of very long chain fatty acids protein n=1 Tax=Stomoxys calcitrans TaxID=35570 RepID=A0A1I8P879_STOCA